MKKITKEIIFVIILSSFYIHAQNAQSAHNGKSDSLAIKSNVLFEKLNAQSIEVKHLTKKHVQTINSNSKETGTMKENQNGANKLKTQILAKEEVTPITFVTPVAKKSTFEEFTLSFSLNFFSEIGDKSFVSIILMYDQITPMMLFLTASLSEILMNFFSVAIGYQMRAHPLLRILCQFAGMITALVFSIMLVYEVVSGESEEEKKESDIERQTDISISAVAETCDHSLEGKKLNITSSNWNTIVKVANIAWIIFLSELGDKSQITTIILSTEYNPIPIFIGTALAHVLGITLSMTIGYIISQNTNKTILTCIGALCFLYFGIQTGHDFYAAGGFKALLALTPAYQIFY
jgi:putative Ca2+/H+ antiporter (TMEM165/GDT1 family)